MVNYTEEQKNDIQEREKKALEILKELQLTPAVAVQKVNIGNDVFVDKLIPFLQDSKYQEEPKNEETKDEPVSETE